MFDRKEKIASTFIETFIAIEQNKKDSSPEQFAKVFIETLENSKTRDYRDVNRVYNFIRESEGLKPLDIHSTKSPDQATIIAVNKAFSRYWK